MIAWVLALAISVGAPADTAATTSGTATDSPAVQVVSDSQELAKLAAVQQAWDGDSANRGPSVPAARPVGSLLAQIVASLAVLLGLAGFAFLILRRIRQKSSGPAARGALLDVLESKALGQGNHLTLVRVHDRVVALGHGPGGVSPITEFQGADAARILAELGDGAVSVRDFTATLDTFLDRFRTAPPAAPRRPESGE